MVRQLRLTSSFRLDSPWRKFPPLSCTEAYVGSLFSDAVARGAIGINYGTGMVLEPRFDVADGSYDAERLRGVLTHEVAHYWWNGNENWVDEGMSEFLAAASYGFPTREWVSSFA